MNPLSLSIHCIVLSCQSRLDSELKEQFWESVGFPKNSRWWESDVSLENTSKASYLR
jgi:hypothetical protein